MIKPTKESIRALKNDDMTKCADPTKRLLKCKCGCNKRNVYIRRNDILNLDKSEYLYKCAKCGKTHGVYADTMTGARVLWNNYIGGMQ